MLRQAALRTVAATWNRLQPPAQSRDCIIVYHSIHRNRPFSTCDPEEFRRQIEWLTSHCDVVGIPEMLESQAPGSTRPRVAITFDDGYVDNYDHAFPLLLEQQARATFFITAGYVDRDPVVIARFQKLRRATLPELEPMTWEQVGEMTNAGMDIGCHTYSHPSLFHLNQDDVASELARSKNLLEERLGRTVSGFAYPFGKPGCTYGPRDAEMAERVGYQYAVTTVNRGLQPNDSPWQLPRIIIGSRFPIQEQVAGFWDCVGSYNERAPTWLARAISPKGFRSSTYGGSYEEMKSRTEA